MYFSFLCVFFSIMYGMYVLILSFILGYGQLLVLDEMRAFLSCSMWVDIVVIALCGPIVERNKMMMMMIIVDSFTSTSML